MLQTIATDLSQEMDKSVRFLITMPKTITSNYYTQRNISRYLINTIKYIIIEHLEIQKERRLNEKPIVCHLELILKEEGDNAVFIFKDDGVKLDPTAIVNRAVERQIITQELGEWMLENDIANVYNLVLKPEFGPPVKPPPLTCYRPYLSMINEEAQNFQGKMTFTFEEGKYNVVRLTIPKERNGIAFDI